MSVMRGDAVLVSGNQATPKYAAVQTSTTASIVAAVSGKKIRVLAAFLSGAGNVNAKWQTHTTGTDLTGLLYMAAGTNIALPFNPMGWFETVAGEALDLNVSAAVAVGGTVVYIEA